MSDFTVAPEEFEINAEAGALGLYQFGTNIAKHYFCKNCGIYPFHETMRKPGHYRVNLGCVEDVDSSLLKTDVSDGKNI